MLGRFITLEGGEGAGKTSQARMLAEAIQEQWGFPVTVTREPGGCPLAEKIRALLLGNENEPWDPDAEILLHFAARRQHVQNVILPELNRGTWVISDRFYDSTMAYQGYAQFGNARLIKQLSSEVQAKPDLTLVLDVTDKTAHERLARRAGDPDRYERMGSAFHTKVREGFLSIAWGDPDRCLVVDANGPKAEVLFCCLAAIYDRLITGRPDLTTPQQYAPPRRPKLTEAPAHSAASRRDEAPPSRSSTSPGSGRMRLDAPGPRPSTE